jgi:hypothetical protein
METGAEHDQGDEEQDAVAHAVSLVRGRVRNTPTYNSMAATPAAAAKIAR